MAVKVMVAPAITKSAVERLEPRKLPEPGEAQRPRRRRSSIYDADGHEVFITLMCLKCRKMRPLSQFGLRKMADGAIRNQPWCRTCRSAAGTKGAARGSAETVDSHVSAGAPGAPGEGETAQPPVIVAEGGTGPRPAQANLATQIAAALAGGLGR